MDGERSAPHSRRTALWVWLALVVIMSFAVGVRYRLLEIPLDRDEGEYAYVGQLMLDGIPPYAQAYNMKLPGVYAVYAVVMSVFGQTVAGIHFGLLLVNGITTLFVFLLARRVSGDLGGVAAAAIFAAMSLSPGVQGLSANAEHFVILFASSGLWALSRATERDRMWGLFGSGLLLGTAFVMKQHGAAFVLAGAAYLLVVEYKRHGSLCDGCRQRGPEPGLHGFGRDQWPVRAGWDTDDDFLAVRRDVRPRNLRARRR